MEAATAQPAAAARPLPTEKAERIVEAMRRSVALRGTAGSTFDHVARDAGVSRGLLHYYFGTKERLLVEVVRRDCELRMAVLDRRLEATRTAEDFIDGLVSALEDIVRDDPDFITVTFALFSLSRRNADISAELAELMRRTRQQVATLLAAKQAEGVLDLRAEPEAVAEVLFALADGVALRMLTDPARDFAPTIAAAVAAVRALLVAGG
jgi:AcrR family transcriptional regulator